MIFKKSLPILFLLNCCIAFAQSTTSINAIPGQIKNWYDPSIFDVIKPSNSLDIGQIIAAMPANSWKDLPNTMMKDVCPLPYNGYACAAVIGAWGGGAFDAKRDRMLIWGGGHADSWYNNLFAFDLPTMTWSRLTEMPAGVDGQTYPAHWYDIRPETCGFMPVSTMTVPGNVMSGNYIDESKCFVAPIVSQLDFQQPRSAHTYGELFVDPIGDRFCSLSSSNWPSAQSESHVVHCFNFQTGLWSRAADRPVNVGAGRGNTAVDAQGNMWTMAGGGGYLGKYNTTNNTWSSYGYVNYESIGGTDIDRKRNYIYTIQHVYGAPDSTHYNLRRWDLNDVNSLNASKTYTDFPTTGDIPTVGDIGGEPGFVYADAYDTFFAWGGGRNVYSLDPVAKVWKRLTATGDDPGAQQLNGTYGRFRYSATYGVFILVNSTTSDVYIYKPTGSKPSGIYTRHDQTQITVSPNPVKNILNISGHDRESVISIYDVTGKLMLQLTAKEEMMNINTDFLPSGFYVINISTSNNTIMKNFIKE